MVSFVVKNNVESAIVDNPLAQAATTLNVTTGDGAEFPSTFPFLITLWDESTYPDPTDDSEMEIIKCTGRSIDALTIVRAQEGTTDVAHASGGRVAMLITAGIFNDSTNGITTKLDGIESLADVTSTHETSHTDVLVDGDINVTVAGALGSDDNYVTDAEKVIIGNTSGANTGDQTLPTDATLEFTDVITNNVSNTKHGFVPKATDVAGQFLKSDGTWGVTAGGGDMEAVTYDPTSIIGDVFAMDNMVEGVTTKILTGTERTLLGNTSGANTGDQTLPTDATLEFTDVITNNVSNTKHGFVPKATDVAGQFLKSDGTWGVTAGGGDMEAVTYDPTSIIGDVFAMDNMVEGVTTKILTGTERTLLGNTSGANTGDQTLPTDATLEFTDVITNNVSNTKHGFVPKATDVAGQFLKSDGTWGVTAGGGDMEAVTYDPTSIIGDVFAMDNMVEGVTTKILTGTERTLLGNTSGANTGDQIASGVTNTAAGGIAATNVQDAINELDTEKTTLTEVKADSDIADLILQSDFIDYTDSPMIVTGGEISIGTNAGTFKVAALTALIRKTDSAIGELAYVTKTEEDNIAIPLSCTNYYVVVNYNGGAPTVSLITDLQNFNNNIPIGSVMKDALNVVHFISGCYRLQGGVAKLHYRAFELYNLYLASGNTIAYSGTNNFTMTAGVMYEGINRLTQNLYNSATNTFNSIQNDNAGGWTENALNVIDYTHYDLADGSGNLGLIGVAKYGCHWVYRHAGECGHVYVLYGTDSYSLAEAEVAKVPNGPDHLTNFGCLIGKIIAPQAGGSFTIQMVTDTTFTGVSIANHDDLGGLNDGDYKHLTATEKTLFDTLDSGADVTANNAPQAHETSHESGGSDELDFDQLADGTTYKKLLATERTKLTGIETAADVTANNAPQAHETSHESGGSDELDFDQLADGTTYKKLLATERTKLTGIETAADVTANNAPQAHETSHESGGSDELDFDQLADGTTYKKLLATERTKLTGIETAADVTANNAPQAHASTHEAGGSDVVSGLLNSSSSVVLNGATVNNVWTDIDLSAVIGSNSALVVLEVYNTSANGSRFGFRPNGNTHGHYCSAGAHAAANKCDLGVNASATDSAIVVVTTSAAGVIEYICNGQATVITLLSFAPM